MSIEKEIERAVRKISADNWNNNPKTSDEQAEIIAAVKTSLKNSTYDFSTVRAMKIKQNEKERLVKQYTEPYSAENILCQCIKQILDKVFKIKYANRGKISKELFSIIPATIQMADFTIVKFDFKDYFNSVSTIYAFEKYIKQRLYDRLEKDLVKSFVYATKYAYAGLCTSNAIAEIIAMYFDEAVKQVFSESGLIYYERYVDDCIMILNEHVEEADIDAVLKDALSKIFHDSSIEHGKCKTKFNEQKFCYISRRKIFMEKNTLSIDFLGYEFQLKAKQRKKEVEIKYGITQAKRKKYSERLDNIISLYMSDKPNNAQSLELLRHRIAAFSSRTVYLSKHFNSNVWHVKGFISNYGELRDLLGTNLIQEETEDFLKDGITDAFSRAKIKNPYFLNCDGYNLLENMKKNKTILLVDHIGYDYHSLTSLCKQIDIAITDKNGKPKGYGNLVREYLIKVRVGY